MGVFSKISIRMLLSTLIGLMGLMLLGAVWPSFHASLTRYHASQRLERLSVASAEVFGALQNLRPERGNTLSALLSESPMTPKYADGVRQLRDATENHYAQAEALLPKLELPGLAPLLGRMKQAHDVMQTFRAKADADAVLPMASRDSAFIAQSAALSGHLLSVLSDVTDLVDASIRLQDPVVDASLTVKREAWMVRNYAGERSLNAKTALGAGKTWTPSQSLAVAESRGQEIASWRLVTELASRADAGVALRAAYEKAQLGYFGQDRVTREAVYDALTAGRRPEMSLDAWLAHINPSLADVSAVANAALDDMHARADQETTKALYTMLAYSGFMGFAMLLALSGLFIVHVRISQPMQVLTQVMRRLAARDFTPSVPGSDRGDELGAMAKAVLVFRENGLTVRKLEADAAEQQRIAEAERAHEEARRNTLQAQQKAVVESLASGLASLAKGDLTCVISTEFAPDYERLRGDFNAALEALRAAVQDVANHSATILSGTQEIASASDDLARRTEQQAAGLEQTAAALQEITGTVRRTAEGSQKARTVVAAAADDAKQSEKIVQGTVTAMGEIEASAMRISQIIGVIEDIAFQTSLLALNAGVEAARAGESGRGFAVVASEVRALAQRSASAAKEIKALIHTSTLQVGRGVGLVGETRQALSRILSQIGVIGQVIGEIAASAQEQATSLIEVNSAVAKMDLVTQENAAMVEQTTAATHSLAHETEGLSRSTQRFRIADATLQGARAGRRTG